MPTFTSHALSLALFILIHAPSISAGGVTFPYLDPMTTAMFAFYVIFAILTFFQAIHALATLRLRKRSLESFPRRILYITILLIATLTLSAMYSLSAVYESQAFEITLTSVNFVTMDGMIRFLHALVHVLLYAGILSLLDYRYTFQFLQYGHARSKQLVIALRCVSGASLFIMFGSTVARVIMVATISVSIDDTPTAAGAYTALYRVFLVSYIVLTIVICAMSILLWRNRQSSESHYHWLMYDKLVLSRIVKIICPVLAIRAVYELIYHILIYIPIPELVHNNNSVLALELAGILIRGLTHLVVIHVALDLVLEKDSRKHVEVD